MRAMGLTDNTPHSQKTQNNIMNKLTKKECVQLVVAFLTIYAVCLFSTYVDSLGN
jgi:hypothetical protein